MRTACAILGVAAAVAVAVGCGGSGAGGSGGSTEILVPPPASHARTMTSGLPAETWVDRTPCPTPAAWPFRIGSVSVAYDTQRGRVVFSGATSFTRQEVWELDPASGVWEDRTPCTLPASWPAPRLGSLMGYDQGRGRTVLFGRAGPSILFETWEWDGNAGTWELRSPDFGTASDPGNDTGSQLEYDPQRRTMVLPGWTLWDWDGTQATWTARWHAPIDAVTPPGGGAGSWRFAMSFGYDPDRSSMFVFGGTSGGYEQILFEYDGASWINRTPSPLPASWPSARGGARMFYESTSRRMVIAGGCGNACPTDDLWAWDPATNTWTGGPPRPSYWPQSSATFASAAGNGRAIAFDNGPADEPWLGPAAVWDLPSGARRDLRGAHVRVRWPVTPSPAAAYDPSRQRVVVFGGDSPTVTRVSNANLVEWNGRDGSWDDRTPDVLPVAWPPARHRHAMAADSRRGRVWLFGGQAIIPGASLSSGGYIGPTFADLWEWDGAAATWTERPAKPMAPWPSAAVDTVMTYDEPRDRLILAATGDGDPWEWSPTALGWTAPPETLTFGSDPLLSFDLPRRRAVMIAGSSAASVAEWDGGGRMWNSRWPPTAGAAGPGLGNSRAAASDPISGFTWLAAPMSLWAWNGGPGTWTDHSVAAAPALPWSGAAPMVFDESRGTLVLLVYGSDVAGHPVLRLFERAVP
jgi:Kelch motif protein